MDSLVRPFGHLVAGVLCGLDKLRFRGSKRQMCHVTGMMSWLGAMRILLNDKDKLPGPPARPSCRAKG